MPLVASSFSPLGKTRYATELRDADALLLGLPLYSGGPPSAVKARFDHIIASSLARDSQTYAPLLAATSP